MGGSLSGKVAVVTGGARGIGKAIAGALAGRGAAVAVWDVLEEAAKETADGLSASGARAIAMRVDIMDGSQVESAAAEVKDALGGLHVLVNNAGIARDKMLLRMSEEDWDRVLAVNLKGAFLCTKAAARIMRKTGGAIVNMSSVVGEIGNPLQANYAASKAGIMGLTKSAARELARYDIRVNAVAPGFIDTEMTRALPEEARKWILANVPLGRPGSPEDVASVVAFLASSEAGYITGQVIKVCGGMVM